MKVFVAATALLLAFAGTSLAQETGPDDRSDLLIPPDLRPTTTKDVDPQPQVHARHDKRTGEPAHAKPDVGHAAASDATTPSRPTPPVEHPTDFSLAVHGGGNVQQHYSVSSGPAAPGEESGDGLAAGFKLGF